MPLRPTFIRLHAALAAALLVALVLAHTLGALHRVAHAGGDNDAVATAASAQQGWLLDLFAGHDHDGGCELFDQLTHGDALCAAQGLPLPSPQPLSMATAHAGWQLAAQAAGFLARGPPALS
jgi:hypothetical protein